VSEIRKIIAAAITDRQKSFGDAVVNLRTRRAFTAEIQEIADIELNAAMGRDARESVTFHISDKVAAAEILLNDLLSALGATFKVLRRSDNPASTQIEFGAMKLTAKDAM